MPQAGYLSSTQTIQSNYSGFTTGSVVFQGTNALAQNNALFFWNNTLGYLGIGTASPDSPLTINASGGTLPPPPTGTAPSIHMAAAYAGGTLLLMDSFNNTPQIDFRRADGPVTAPTAIQAGDILMNLIIDGYGTTGYQSSGAAKIVSTAVENFSDTTGAAVLQFYTRPSGTVGAASERVRIDQNGNVGIGTTGPIATLDVTGAGTVRAGAILGASATPTIAYGTGAGTGPSTVVALGSQVAGYIQFTTGLLPVVGTVITFTCPIAAPNYILGSFFPANANAAAAVSRIYSGSTATTFTLNTGGAALAGSTTYAFNFFTESY